MQATKVYQTLALLLLWSISLSEAQTEHHLIETSETAKEYDASEVIGKTPVSSKKTIKVILSVLSKFLTTNH